jgi:ribonuclease P protein component
LLTVQSLRKQLDFQRVMKSGESWADRKFVLVATNQMPSAVTTRFGFSVSKRIGNAVIRNQMKRRLRSIVYGFDFNEGWDAVLIARKGSIDCTYKEIESSVSRLLIKSGMAADRSESKTR